MAKEWEEKVLNSAEQLESARVTHIEQTSAMNKQVELIRLESDIVLKEARSNDQTIQQHKQRIHKQDEMIKELQGKIEVSAATI